MSDTPTPNLPATKDKTLATAQVEGAIDKRLSPRPMFVQALHELRDAGLDNAVMQEQYFEPFVKALFNRESQTFNLALWYDTLGSHRKGIDVVDTQGALLFRAPPLIGTVVTNLGSRSNSLSLAADYAELAAKRHPALGQKTINQALHDYHMGNHMVPKEQWIAILSRYGLVDIKPAHDVTGHAAPEAVYREEDL